MGLKQEEKKRQSTGERINKIGLVIHLGINVRENRLKVYYHIIGDSPNITRVKRASSGSLQGE